MQEIQLYSKIQDPIAAAAALGKPFAVMFGLTTEAQGVFLALASMAENKTPFDIVRTYHIIDGKLNKKALAIFAEFRARGGKVKWINTGKDGKKAEAEFTFEGQTVTESFTIEEAQKMELIRPRSNWTKSPANMLRARVLSNAISMLCPEIVAGVADQPEDEGDTAPVEKQIFSEPAAPAPAKPAKAEKAPKAEKIIDVEPEPAAAAPQAEPAQAAPAPEPPKPIEIRMDTKAGRLTVESIQAVEAAIGDDNAEKALKWMEAKGWIPPMGGLLNLSIERARKIVNAPEKFAEILANWNPEAK